MVDVAIRGYYSPLRSDPNAKGKLIIELPLIAQQYGARQNIDKDVYKECVRLVMEKFKSYGIDEIREAYRLKASGFLEAPGAEMWGGEFNADQLGKVLTAYRLHRRRIIAEYTKERDKVEEIAKEQRLRAEFENKFPKMIEKARQTTTDWRDVPEYWYNAARKRGMIEFNTSEAKKIFQEAKELARMELENEKQGANRLKAMQISAALAGENDMAEHRAKVIARKITVFRKLIRQ